MLQTYHTKQWIHNARSRWAPPALIYLKVEHKWKTANSTQHPHAGHVSLDIKCNESHTSPVWTGWKWCSSNEPASQLNVFTLHTPLWRCWCERLQVSSAGKDCQRKERGRCPRSGSGRTKWEWSHSSLGTSACYGEDREHDSLGMGLCTFYTELHVNVKGHWTGTPG